MDPINKATKDAKFLNEYSKIVKERSKGVELGNANSEIGKFVKKRRDGGDTLVKAATVLLICPDPITGAAALPLLAAAAAKSRKKSTDLERVYRSVNEIASALSSGGLSL